MALPGVQVIIKDTGWGISEDQLDVLFEPFNRLGREFTDVEGSGIGLTITKKLVELMGGEIALTSEQGQGTRVVIDMPAGLQPQEETQDSEIEKIRVPSVLNIG